MRRRANQKKLIPLVLALLATMVGAALAVPAINVSVQELDKGTGGYTQTVSSAAVNWELQFQGGQYVVTGAIIHLNQDPQGNGHVYVVINGNNYEAQYDSNNGYYTVAFSPALSLDDISNINTVTIVYQGQEVNA
ncbi:hypothetical protein A3L09_01905 [Thermococcus profundus]|uniref:Uncharacterized protein n=1 Tax=Thermococcus profundus TaxID=49899 RepID=A0A2Z2MJH7_THEPR|nr:hypothetical protein [Thermococcus profundus]ASJ02108.1 hypothetical protein A3L09_01905 [Thermococcus profundus]